MMRRLSVLLLLLLPIRIAAEDITEGLVSQDIFEELLFNTDVSDSAHHHKLRQEVITKLLETNPPVAMIKRIAELESESDIDQLLKKHMRQPNVAKYYLLNNREKILKQIETTKSHQGLLHLEAHLRDNNESLDEKWSHRLLYAFCSEHTATNDVLADPLRIIKQHSNSGLDSRDEQQRTVLMKITQEHRFQPKGNSYHAVLLKSGANPHAVDQNGRDILYYAITCGQDHLVRHLVTEYPDLLSEGGYSEKDRLQVALSCFDDNEKRSDPPKSFTEHLTVMCTPRACLWCHDMGNVWKENCSQGFVTSCLLAPLVCCVYSVCFPVLGCCYCATTCSGTAYSGDADTVDRRLNICNTLLDAGASHDEAMRKIAKRCNNRLYERMRREASSESSTPQMSGYSELLIGEPASSILS